MNNHHFTDPSFSPSRTKLAGFLCYINGLMVPVISVTVTTAVGQIPSAQINFFPSRLLQRLGAEDRVEVVVFYLDNDYLPDAPAYRLLFEGEIIGWSYESSAEGRNVTASAVADLSILEQIDYSFLNTASRIAGHETGAGNNASGVAQPGAFYGYSLFQHGLLYAASGQGVTAGSPVPNIERPFELLYNVVKALTAKQVPAEQRSIPVVNFFSRWARKRNFINRFVANPGFDDAEKKTGAFPIIRAAQALGALQELQDKVADGVGDGTLMDVLNRVFQNMYYEIATLMTPPAVRADLKTGAILGNDLANANDLHPIRLVNYYAKPQMLFSIPPACNIVFPSMVKSLQYTENYRSQPTRVYMNDEFMASLIPDGDGLAATALSLAYPPPAQASIQSRFPANADGTWRTEDNARAVSSGKNMLLWPEEFFKGPVVHRSKVPELFGALAQGLGAKKAQADATRTAPLADAYSNVAPIVAEEQRTRVLLELYVQYEYYRLRYSQRGGAADLVFNPYIVPGYPLVLFDRKGGLDQIGYVHTVSHTVSSRGMSTNINYGSGRTIREWLALIESDVTRLGVVLGSSPAEPVDQVRQITQAFDNAERHYRQLFHAGQGFTGATPVRRAASFDVRQVLTSDQGDIELKGPTEATVTLQSSPVPLGGGAFAPADKSREQVSRAALRYKDELRPTAAFERLFEDTNEALAYVARPVCTIDEYLLFRHGVSKAKDLPPEIAAAANVYRPHPASPATAYYRIRRINYAKDFTPAPEDVGYATTPAKKNGNSTQEVVSNFVAPRTVSAVSVQSRADWDSILMAYRDEVLKNVAPLE